MSSNNRFDDLLNSLPENKPEQTPKQPKSKQKRTKKKVEPWADIEAKQKEPSIRLNVDIPISIDDALAQKARQLRVTKAYLIRELLKWALEDEVD